MKIGFIGLGSQGAPMAQRIIEAGFDVTLWARNERSLQPFIDSDASFSKSVSELAGAAEHVGICVVDDNGVRQICDELIPGMSAGGTILIHSTVTPSLCRQLAQEGAERGIQVLDAPVSGGGGGAANGTLTVMVGGSEAALATVKPVLQSFASLIIHLGEVGCGQNAKLVNNTLMAAHVAIAHYGLQVADELGINRESLIELVNASSGRSFGFEIYARQKTPSAFKHGASLLAKDVQLLDNALDNKTSLLPIRELALPLMKSIANSKSDE